MVTTGTTDVNFIGSQVSVSAASPTQSDVLIPPGNKVNIPSWETFNILIDYQFFVYGNFTIAGTVNNYGEIIIANGVLNIISGGQLNNIGIGMVRLLNLATGTSTRVHVVNFSTTAYLPHTITHSLGTKDFLYTVREGNYPIDVNLHHLNDNQVTITTNASIASATIIFQAKM